MEGKRRIHIVSFLNFIQEKGRGRQRKPMEKQVAIFDGVQPEASLKCFIANPIKNWDRDIFDIFMVFSGLFLGTNRGNIQCKFSSCHLSK
jgi:hypothetical protein